MEHSILTNIQSKIQTWDAAAATIAQWKINGQTVIFTNGCFDIIHYGHLHYLADAKALGDKLIVGLNAEASVKRLKGKHRPINDSLTRRYMLASLEFVDMVVEFEEDTPFNLIQTLMPNILVKGGDWQVHQIVGADIILANDGKVLSLPFVEGYSTTNIEQKIIKNSKPS